VDHQSPQVLVVKNGSVVASASHYDLVEIDLEKAR
jgi:bacillithiol system protein YtxJ